MKAKDYIFHNRLVHCLFQHMREAGFAVQKEPLNLLNDGSGDRPADLFVLSTPLIM